MGCVFSCMSSLRALTQCHDFDNVSLLLPYGNPGFTAERLPSYPALRILSHAKGVLFGVWLLGRTNRLLPCRVASPSAPVTLKWCVTSRLDHVNSRTIIVARLD